MQLDVITLMAADSFVAAIGVLLMGAIWFQFRAVRALIWWTASYAVLALGIGVLAIGHTFGLKPALGLGGLLTFTCPALIWTGTRVFNGRRPPWLVFAIGFAGWLATTLVAVQMSFESAPAAIGFAASTAFLAAATWELWRSRAEPLKARWPLMGFFVVHALVSVGGVYDSFATGIPDGGIPLGSWLGLTHFETLVFVVGTAVFMALLCKERSELGLMRFAQSDALTGVANRGAFFAGAERLMIRAIANGTPLGVIAFDLDRFKSINDLHGHAMGDKVLRLFADTTRLALRPADFFGRHGGEEFAVVLPGSSVETAYAIADRIRRNFAEAAREVDGVTLNATVSAGAAIASLSDSFSDALESADRALYLAKNRGRNRVERASGNQGTDPGNVVHVA